MPGKLYAYLGADLTLYVSPAELNPVGQRVAKGAPLPREVREMSEPVQALVVLQEYFDRQEKR